MTFNKGLKYGIKGYSLAFKFMNKHNLNWYLLYPLVLNIILFIIGYFSTISLSAEYFEYIKDWTNMESWEFWGSGFLSSVIMLFMNIFIRFIFIIFFAYVGGYLVIILLSPIYALLSEKVESILTGNSYPFEINQFLKDIWRGIKLALRNFAIEIFLTIVLLILSLIPFVGFFTGLAMFFISSYFYGFSFIDYSLERKKMDIKHSIAFVKTNKGLAIGNGSVFSIVLLIPFIGVLVASFVSIISIVAATIATTEIMVKED